MVALRVSRNYSKVANLKPKVVKTESDQKSAFFHLIHSSSSSSPPPPRHKRKRIRDLKKLCMHCILIIKRRLIKQ